MSLLNKDSNLIGLDIGTTGIRLVQVRGGPGAKLVTYAATSVDPKMVQSDSEADKQQIATIVKKLVADSKATSRRVVAGIPTAKVFASVISLPKMSNQEVDKAIQYQAEQHVPMALDQVKLDWMLAGDSADGKQQEVLLVATPQTLAERYLSLLEAAGLDVEALEPDALALVRSMLAGTETAVALDVGGTSTDLVIVAGGQPKLIRSLPVGGETFVRAAMQNLNLEADQAMQFVYKFGLAQSKFEGQVNRAIKASVDNLVSELDKSIKFFQTRYKDINVEKIVLTGKASVVPELPVYIANGVNLPVEIGNAWAHIDAPVDLANQLMELSSQFAVACGLSLRGGAS